MQWILRIIVALSGRAEPGDDRLPGSEDDRSSDFEDEDITREWL